MNDGYISSELTYEHTSVTVSTHTPTAAAMMIWVHSEAEAWEAAKVVSDDGKSVTVRLQSGDYQRRSE